MLISSDNGTVQGLHQNIYYSGNTLMLHTKVFTCVLLSQEPGPINDILEVKATVDQMKCAVDYGYTCINNMYFAMWWYET